VRGGVTDVTLWITRVTSVTLWITRVTDVTLWITRRDRGGRRSERRAALLKRITLGVVRRRPPPHG